MYSLIILKSANLWFWQIRNRPCRQVCDLPLDKIRRPCPADGHRERIESIPNGRRDVALVAQFATERFLDRNTHIWYRISLRGNEAHLLVLYWLIL